MKSGCPYSRAIKQSLNKALQNKSAVNFHLADLIASFSHTSLVKKGSQFRSDNGFFVVQEMLSQNWCLGFFCQPKMELTVENHSIVPNLRRRTKTIRKRLFDPFEQASVRCRHRSFHLQIK